MIMMRTFASWLFRWPTMAVYGSRRVHFQHDRTEFPMAWPSACNFKGSRAADCASIDALRPFFNWVKFKDIYETSFIRERRPAFARRIPPARRSSALSRRGRESSQENILAATGCIFRKRTKKAEADAGGAQRHAAIASSAQT